jgi:hypothetical protein
LGHLVVKVGTPKRGGRQWQTTPKNFPRMQRTRAIPIAWLSSGLCPDRPKGWIPIVIIQRHMWKYLTVCKTDKAMRMNCIILQDILRLLLFWSLEHLSCFFFCYRFLCAFISVLKAAAVDDKVWEEYFWNELVGKLGENLIRLQ